MLTRQQKESTYKPLFIHTMKNILVIGATGQIGSELTMKLRGIYGNDHVVCGYIPSAAPQGALAESGPAEICDVTNGEQIAEVVLKHVYVRCDEPVPHSVCR